MAQRNAGRPLPLQRKPRATMRSEGTEMAHWNRELIRSKPKQSFREEKAVTKLPYRAVQRANRVAAYFWEAALLDRCRESRRSRNEWHRRLPERKVC